MFNKIISILLSGIIFLSISPLMNNLVGAEGYTVYAEAGNRTLVGKKDTSNELKQDEAEEIINTYLMCSGVAFSKEELSDEIIAQFAVNYCYYLYFNNQLKDVKKANGNLYFKKSSVHSVSQKFFNQSIKKPDQLGTEIYKDGYYIRPLADGNIPPSIKIKGIMNEGNGCYKITGNLFDEIEEEVKTTDVEVKLKCVIKNGKKSIVLIEFKYSEQSQ